MAKKKKYKLIITNNKKEVEFLGAFSNKKQVYKLFNSIVNQNNLIKFPLKYTNFSKNNKPQLLLAQYELLILELNNDNKPYILPNEIGKQVEHIISNNDKWLILDKMYINKEETFWFYGYHPRHDKKDVNFIINSIKKGVKEFYIYSNKIIIRYIDDIYLILCKCHEDSKRLLMYIQNTINDKEAIFYYNITPSLKNTIINLISKKTGWNYRKITRKRLIP